MRSTLPIRAGVPGAVTASKERLGTRSAIVVRVDSTQQTDLPATVLEAADAALYEAKNAGKGRWVAAAR